MDLTKDSREELMLLVLKFALAFGVEVMEEPFEVLLLQETSFAFPFVLELDQRKVQQLLDPHSACMVELR